MHCAVVSCWAVCVCVWCWVWHRAVVPAVSWAVSCDSCVCTCVLCTVLALCACAAPSTCCGFLWSSLCIAAALRGSVCGPSSFGFICMMSASVWRCGNAAVLNLHLCKHDTTSTSLFRGDVRICVCTCCPCVCCCCCCCCCSCCCCCIGMSIPVACTGCCSCCCSAGWASCCLDMKVTPLREGSATNASALWWSRLGRVSDSGMPSMWAPQEMCGLPTPCLMLMFDPFQ